MSEFMKNRVTSQFPASALRSTSQDNPHSWEDQDGWSVHEEGKMEAL